MCRFLSPCVYVISHLIWVSISIGNRPYGSSRSCRNFKCDVKRHLIILDFFLKIGILRAKVYTKNVPNIEECNFMPAPLRTLITKQGWLDFRPRLYLVSHTHMHPNTAQKSRTKWILYIVWFIEKGSDRPSILSGHCIQSTFEVQTTLNLERVESRIDVSLQNYLCFWTAKEGFIYFWSCDSPSFRMVLISEIDKIG